MGSRKESMKKALGITEYPWSSDDEEPPAPQSSQDAHSLRRQSGEARSSVADMPGTSGLQPPSESPTSPRKVQAKMDRDLFWSILNNTHRPATAGVVRSTAKPCDVPMCYVPRPSPHASSGNPRDRSGGSADIQRILAFKKLTRSINNYNQNKPSGNWYSLSSRVNSGPSRSTLFSPTSAVLASDLAASRRSDPSFTRYPPTRNTLPSFGRIRSSDAIAMRLRASRHSAAEVDNTFPSVPEPYVNVDQSDDDAVETSEPTPDANGNVEAANAEGHNSSAGGVSLEEEIVEVDAPDDADGDAPVHVDEYDAQNDAIMSPPIEENRDATMSPENAESSQPQGVKRKRESNDDSSSPEPYSVKEFNQKLLRLLECPVCLEWMEPPISQCRRGHLVCARCRARLASCPVCRTTFSSVRNRAMEGVAEMLRYPCRHGCGREVRLRRRAAHEASCAARRYHCPAPVCAQHHPLQRHHLADHFQSKHLSILKIGRKHKFSMKVNSEQHDTWLIMALDEFFHLRVDVDIRTWGVVVYVAFIGPKCNAKNFIYEVTVEGQHSSRKLVYTRSVHSDLESPSLNVSRQDCFHLTLDQALNFLRFKNRHCESDKFLDFNVEITKEEVCEAVKDESES